MGRAGQREHLMKHILLIVCLMSVIPCVSPAATTISGRTLYGPANAWNSSMNPIIVTGDITIDKNATLTINPGCEVRFQENGDDTHWGWDILRSEIIVYGELNIAGTPAEPVTLTSTGVGPQGWFGIIFSDETGTGTIQYCSINHSVYGVNVTACSAATPPTISNCLIYDVTTGFMFDNSSMPSVTDCTILSASEGFRCQGYSEPSVENCNIAEMNGLKRAVYATESSTAIFRGCAFSSGSIDADRLSAIALLDTTVSDTAAGIVGHESKQVGSALTLSLCAMYVSNCNIIGLGDGGNGIDWDDNLETITVEYSRIGGFKSNVMARMGDPIGFPHPRGPGFSPPYPVRGICTGGSNTALQDKYTDFGEVGELIGQQVYNETDSSAGIVTGLGTTTYPDDTLLIAGGMSGGATNDRGDYYYVVPLTIIRGFCSDNGGNIYVIDRDVDFREQGAYPGMLVYNDIKGSSGLVDGIITTVNSNDTLVTTGMSGGLTNDDGDLYHFAPLYVPGANGDYNNIDLGDLLTDPANPFRKWPNGYVPSVGQNEFYGVQDPKCMFNIEMEDKIIWTYLLEVWAEGNWWVTTDDAAITRYNWDYYDYVPPSVLGGAHYLPHRAPDEKRTYSVSGRIVDGLNQPLGGVRVYADISVQFPGHTVLADITNLNGYYTIYGLLPHLTAYSVIPQKLGCSFNPPLRSVTIDPTNPSDTIVGDFTATLPPPHVGNAGRSDGKDGEEYGLPGRTNWAVRAEITTITVMGTDFRETPSVYLRGPYTPGSDGLDTACSNVVWGTSTSLTAVVPAGMGIGDYYVVVKNPDGQESNPWDKAMGIPGFTIVPALRPWVTGIGPNPIYSTYASDLTVSGRNFQAGCNLVIGGHTWAGLTPTEAGTVVTVSYAPGTLSGGTYTVTVTNPDGQSSNTDVTLTVNAVPPTVTPAPTAPPTQTPIQPTPTPTPKYPRIQPSTNAASYNRGDYFSLSIELWPDSGDMFNNLVDVYLAMGTPDGHLLFLSKGQWKTSTRAFYSGAVIGTHCSFNVGSYKLSPKSAPGIYTIYGVLNTPKTSVYKSGNWRSSLASTTFFVQ